MRIRNFPKRKWPKIIALSTPYWMLLALILDISLLFFTLGLSEKASNNNFEVAGIGYLILSVIISIIASNIIWMDYKEWYWGTSVFCLASVIGSVLANYGGNLLYQREVIIFLPWLLLGLAITAFVPIVFFTPDVKRKLPT